MKPLFTDNHKNNRKITLIDGEKIISNDTEVAEIMNYFFSNAVSKFDIKGYKIGVSNIGTKFAEHPSILKIKQMIHTKNKFTFPVQRSCRNKPTTFNNIPAKLIAETSDICAPFISSIYI